jgi:(5-formylfuran-3-yl)methyl phosphate synthase
MTAMLASVSDVEETEVALAIGADIIDLKDPEGGALGALPAEKVAEIVKRVDGARPISAVLGVFPSLDRDLQAAIRSVAQPGVDFIKVGLLPEVDVAAAAQKLIAHGAGRRLIAVLFADREGEPLKRLPMLAQARFAGVMLDTWHKTGGRLLSYIDIVGLQAFVAAAREHGLLVGLAGGLEGPDVPRLLPLRPDVLGFRGALCTGQDRRARADRRAAVAIRRLIPREGTPGSGNVDYRFLKARADFWAPAADEQTDRIYVRDLVLPVRIGAYSHERVAPQKVRFDVAVDVLRGKVTPSGMSDVFSYDLISDAINSNIAAGHVDLVETLAERITTDLLKHPRAKRVTLRIEKLELGAGALGVEIVRERPDLARENPVLAMIDGGWRKPGA